MKNVTNLFILNIMSIAIMLYGIAMIPSLIMAIRYGETGIYTAMSYIIASCIPLGFIGYKFIPNHIKDVKMSVCYTTTIFTWIVVIILSSIPYFTAGKDYQYIDCLFESVASWTTTGASAIATTSLPIGLKLWRATCNWMGGIGIILLTLSLFPNWKYIGQKLASTEIRGPGFLMSTTTFRKAYRRILIIYVGITIVHYLALRCVGMMQLNSLLTALSNVSTSGLQHLNNGVIVDLSTPIKIVITIFAFLGSINVSTFVMVLVGKIRNLINNSEIKMYLLIITVVTLVMSSSLYMNKLLEGSQSDILGNTFMQVVSFASTAGYIVTKCDHWNSFNICMISILMFIGACAISTGGGLKVSRIVYSFKALSLNLYKHIHPRSVRTILYNKQPAKWEHVTRSNTYIALFLIIYILGGILITADGTDVYTALSYSQAMLTNVGSPISQLSDPGLVSNMSAYSKSIMCFLMLCGRLEIYPVLMLFSLSLWKPNHTK